jgi:hypothetical protein
MVTMLIAVFMAAQHPTHKNCSALRDALIDATIVDMSNEDPKRVHVDEDLKAIKQFITKTCPDGVKR